MRLLSILTLFYFGCRLTATEMLFNYNNFEYRLSISDEKIGKLPSKSYEDLPISFNECYELVNKSIKLKGEGFKNLKISEISLEKENAKGNLSYLVALKDNITNGIFYITLTMDGRTHYPTKLKEKKIRPAPKPKSKNFDLRIKIRDLSYKLSLDFNTISLLKNELNEKDITKVLDLVKKQLIKDFPTFKFDFFYTVTVVYFEEKYFYKVGAWVEPSALITYYVPTLDRVISPTKFQKH